MSLKPVAPLCPLCWSTDGRPFYQDSREYFRCPVCSLVFVPPHQFLSPVQEKAEYELHQNAADDAGYRRFLARLFDPVSQRLTPHSRGLDFGCGPGPALSVMFQEAGHSMAIYDPFYAPDPAPLQQQYDFIVASEVVEHLHHPRHELDRLWSCLKAPGLLGIMTKRVISQDAFSRWHYKRDLTHVCFYSSDTFRWLAVHWDATVVFPGSAVVLLSKRHQITGLGLAGQENPQDKRIER